MLSNRRKINLRLAQPPNEPSGQFVQPINMTPNYYSNDISCRQLYTYATNSVCINHYCNSMINAKFHYNFLLTKCVKMLYIVCTHSGHIRRYKGGFDSALAQSILNHCRLDSVLQQSVERLENPMEK